MSNYSTKTDLQISTGVDTSSFAKKTDLAILKSEVDKLDIDQSKNVPSGLSNLKSKVDKLDVSKLVPVPVDLIKLSDVVKNDVVKKDAYIAKIKNNEDEIPDITNLAYTTLNAEINKFGKEIPSLTKLVTTTALNAKINEFKNKIPNITNLASTTAFTTVENKIPNVSNLVKKLTITQKLVKLKIKFLLIIIVINILLFKNLIS